MLTMPDKTCEFAIISYKEMDEKDFDKIDNYYCLGHDYSIGIQIIQD